MKLFKLLELPPLYLVFLIAIPNIGLIVLSMLLNIDFMTVPETYEFAGKKTGYIQSINWSFTFTILFPALVATCAILYQRTTYLIRRLPKSEMLWEKGKPIQSDALEAAWRSRNEKIMSVVIWIIMFVAAVLCMKEWFSDSLSPLFSLSSNPSFEPDWAAASAIGHEVVGGAVANATFSFLAFLLQFILLIFGLAGCVLIGVYSQFLHDASTDGIEGQLILPNYKDRDTRKGFQLHSEFCQYAIGFFVILFLIIYVSQLHNNFLRDETHSTIFSYLGERSSAGLEALINGDMKALFSITISQNYSNIATAIAAALVVLLAGTIVGHVLRGAANNARDNALDMYREKNTTGSASEKKNCTKAIAQLDGMVAWPFGNKTTNILLFLVFFPILALIFDAVVVALAAALAVTLVTRAFKSASTIGSVEN